MHSFILVTVAILLTPTLSITKTLTGDDKYHCRNGSMISKTQVCNGDKDCPLEDDEMGCEYLSEYACESHVLQLKCMPGEKISIIHANYGRFNKHICVHRQMHNLKCKSPVALDIIRKNCQHKQSCEVPSNNGVFGDPCVGTYKYIEVQYNCEQVPECDCSEFTCNDGSCLQLDKKCDGHRDCSTGEDELKCTYATAYACEDSTPVVIQCNEEEEIQVLGANYGRNLKYVCKYQENTNCNSPKSTKIIQDRCNGKNQCTVFAQNSVFGDPCSGVHKYLAVNYICVNPNIAALDLRSGVRAV